jgi:hypothetical protein
MAPNCSGPDASGQRRRISADLILFIAMTSLTVSAESTGSIEGRVTDGVTGEAVSGVEVRFLDQHSYVHGAVTDSTGSYRLTGLNDGDYSGQFTKEGFSDTRLSQRVHVAGDGTARANVQIQPWGALRGRVVDEDGRPAAGVRVECACASDTITGENGDFAFHDVRPGSYTLVAKPEARIQVEDGERLGTVAIYYPSVTELQQAVRIPVRYGEDVAGIQIRLKSVPVRRVTGVVVNEAGKAVARATVRLMGRAGTARRLVMFSSGLDAIGPVAEPEVARVETRADGTFEFAAVEPGDWRLSAEAGVDDDMPLGGVASVTVTEKDAEEVQVRMVAPFGVAFTDDRRNVQGPVGTRYGGIPVLLSPMEGQPRVIVDPAKNVGKLNGVLPGRYTVVPQFVGGDFYISSVMWEGRDVAGQVVEFAAGAAPLELIYKSEVGIVRGRAERGEGSLVFLVPRNLGEFTIVRTALCGSDGVFQLDRIAPGDYQIVAFDHADERGVDWSALLSLIAPAASEVRLEAGATASAALSVNKWPW